MLSVVYEHKLDRLLIMDHLALSKLFFLHLSLCKLFSAENFDEYYDSGIRAYSK